MKRPKNFALTRAPFCGRDLRILVQDFIARHLFGRSGTAAVDRRLSRPATYAHGGSPELLRCRAGSNFVTGGLVSCGDLLSSLSRRELTEPDAAKSTGLMFFMAKPGLLRKKP